MPSTPDLGDPVTLVLALLGELKLVVAVDANLGIGSDPDNRSGLRKYFAPFFLSLVRSCPWIDFVFVQEPTGFWKGLNQDFNFFIKLIPESQRANNALILCNTTQWSSLSDHTEYDARQATTTATNKTTNDKLALGSYHGPHKMEAEVKKGLLNDFLQGLNDAAVRDTCEALLAGADTNIPVGTYDPPAGIQVAGGDQDQRNRVIDVFFYRDMRKILVWSLPCPNWVFDHNPLLGIFGMKKRKKQSEETEDKINEWAGKLGEVIKKQLLAAQEISAEVAQEIYNQAGDFRSCRMENKLREAKEKLREELKAEGEILIKAMADIATPSIRSWARGRRNTVRALEDLADEMETMIKATSGVTIAGSAVGIVGGGFLLASVFVTGGLTAPLLVGGGAGLVASTTATVGADIWKSVSKSEKMERVREMVELDQKGTVELRDTVMSLFGSGIMAEGVMARVFVPKLAQSSFESLPKILGISVTKSAGRVAGKVTCAVFSVAGMAIDSYVMIDRIANFGQDGQVDAIRGMAAELRTQLDAYNL